MFKHARFSALLLLVSSTGAFAASDGFYAGASLGETYAEYKTGNFDYMSSATIKKDGLGGGVFFGYQMSPMLAIQAGYTRAHRVNYDNITMASNTPGGLTTLPNGNIVLNIVDVAAKVMLPLKYGFGANAKLGAAYVKSELGGGLDNQPSLGDMYKDSHKVLPEAGFGVSYDVSNHVQTDLGYTRIFKGGNIQNINMAMFSLGYHFG